MPVRHQISWCRFYFAFHAFSYQMVIIIQKGDYIKKKDISYGSTLYCSKKEAILLKILVNRNLVYNYFLYKMDPLTPPDNNSRR